MFPSSELSLIQNSFNDRGKTRRPVISGFYLRHCLKDTIFMSGPCPPRLHWPPCPVSYQSFLFDGLVRASSCGLLHPRLSLRLSTTTATASGQACSVPQCPVSFSLLLHELLGCPCTHEPSPAPQCRKEKAGGSEVVFYPLWFYFLLLRFHVTLSLALEQAACVSPLHLCL